MFNITISSAGNSFIIDDTSEDLSSSLLLELIQNITKAASTQMHCLVMPTSLSLFLSAEQLTCSLDICSIILQKALEHYKAIKPLSDNEKEASRQALMTIKHSLIDNALFIKSMQNPPCILSNHILSAEDNAAGLGTSNKRESAESALQRYLDLIEIENKCSIQTSLPSDTSIISISSIIYSTPSLTPLWASLFSFNLEINHHTSITTLWIKKEKKKSMFLYPIYQLFMESLTTTERLLTSFINNSPTNWAIVLTSPVSADLPTSIPILNSDPHSFLAIASVLNYSLEAFHKITGSLVNVINLDRYRSLSQSITCLIEHWESVYEKSVTNLFQCSKPCPLPSPNPLCTDRVDFCLDAFHTIDPSLIYPSILIPRSLLNKKLTPTSLPIFAFRKNSRNPKKLQITILEASYESHPFYIYMNYCRKINRLLTYIPPLLAAADETTLSLPTQLQQIILQAFPQETIQQKHISGLNNPLYYWSLIAICHYSLICLHSLFTQQTLQISARKHQKHLLKLVNIINNCQQQCTKCYPTFPLHHLFILPDWNSIIPSSPNVGDSTTSQKTLSPLLTQPPLLQSPVSKEAVENLIISSDDEDTAISSPTLEIDFSALHQQDNYSPYKHITKAKKRSAPQIESDNEKASSSKKLKIASISSAKVHKLQPFLEFGSPSLTLSLQDILDKSEEELASLISWTSYTDPGYHNCVSAQTLPHIMQTHLVQQTVLAKNKYRQLATLTKIIQSYLNQTTTLPVVSKIPNITVIESSLPRYFKNLFLLLFVTKIISFRIVHPLSFSAHSKKHFIEAKIALQQFCEKLLSP